MVKSRFGSRFAAVVLLIAVAASVLVLTKSESAQATVGSCGSDHYHSVGHPIYGGQVYHTWLNYNGGWENWYEWDVVGPGQFAVPPSYIGHTWCGGYPPWA